MITRTNRATTSLGKRRAGARWMGALFVLLGGAAVMSFAGCLEDGGTLAPGGKCKEGEIVDPDQTDCIKQVCRGGNEVNEPDDTEVPDDKNPCTLDSCAAGSPQHTATAGACMLGGKAGSCVMGKCEIACTDAKDCNDDNKCTTDTCNGTTKTCDFTNDDALSPDDMNPCTTDTCKDGKESHVPNVGATCGTSGTCDKNGVCIGCAQDADCPPDDDCNDWACVNKECKSTFKNEGMPVAAQNMGDCQVKVCQMGQAVSQPDDTDKPVDGNGCTDDVCTSGVPSNPAMMSGTGCMLQGANNSQTPRCDGNKTCVECLQTADCKLDFTCDMNKCWDCNDNQKNGTETDVDCGGGCVASCKDAQGCKIASDCISGNCEGGICVSCFDGVKNGGEGDIDCGGSCMLKCAPNQGCGTASDCASGVCNAGKCAAPSCNDGVKNGQETDKDCGGSCPKCPNGSTCNIKQDCVSNNCDPMTKTCK
jgi:hypothetical protein